MKGVKFYAKAIVFVFLLFSFNKAISQLTQTFNFTGTIQTFTVPSCVSTITIDARGAQGGGSFNGAGGLGARMVGTYTVVTGTVYTIVVGQQGLLQVGGNVQNSSGGGGGTFVYSSGPTLLVAAGGGGGKCNFTGSAALHAGAAGTISANGNQASAAGALGGIGGLGGATGLWVGTPCAGGGAGWLGVGGGPYGGLSFPTWAGGPGYCTGGGGGCGGVGGYGGGGGGGNLYGGGGGGGGYSGGGGGTDPTHGGGGGSFSTGANQSNTSGFQTGNGQVIISYFLGGNSVNASASPSLLCSGSSATLTATGMNTYTWSTGSNASSIVVSPNTTTTYTASGTNSVGCISTQVLTLTVSSGTPVISITSSTNSLCFGKTATLTANGAINYTWTNGVSNGVSFTPSVTNVYTVTGQNGCGTATAVTSITVAPLPLNVISTPTSICAGSPATLTAVSPGTSYTWQPFALTGNIVYVNPNVTTVYSVTATDGTCSGVANVTLTVIPVPTVAIVSTASNVCFGTQVNMTASGGVSYTWNPGNVLSPSIVTTPTALTLYSVVASNSLGCTSLASQVVIVNFGPTVNITASSLFVCPGDPITLTASGANSYTWSPNNANTPSINDNPLVSTIYTVTGLLQGNICPTSSTVGVNVYQPNVSITSSNSAVCSGATAVLTASGATSYQWSNGQSGSTNSVSPSSTTIYTLTATSSTANLNCITISTIQVNVNPNPSVTVVASKTIICSGGERSTLTANGANTYSWSTGSQSTNVIVTPALNTTYTVVGTNTNNCSKTATIQVRVVACPGFAELDLNNSISVFPNPSNGEFVVEAGKEANLEIVNELGQVVKRIVLGVENNYKANISGLANGLYFIVEQNSSSAIRQKIIINK